MGEVVKLTPKSADDTLKSMTVKREKYCTHKLIEIDVDEREIRCQQCNSVVDPFSFILDMAYEENRQQWTLKELKTKIEELTKDRDKLQREVNNLRAQKRRII